MSIDALYDSGPKRSQQAAEAAAKGMRHGRIIRVDLPKNEVLVDFGGKDQGITPADVNAFATALKKDGKKFDIKVYHDAGHAFMNPNNKGGYVKADAEDAQARIDRFLRETLKRT